VLIYPLVIEFAICYLQPIRQHVILGNVYTLLQAHGSTIST